MQELDSFLLPNQQCYIHFGCLSKTASNGNAPRYVISHSSEESSQKLQCQLPLQLLHTDQLTMREQPSPVSFQMDLNIQLPLHLNLRASYVVNATTAMWRSKLPPLTSEFAVFVVLICIQISAL